MDVRSEEPRMADPSVDVEPDLRLTAKEWIIYWRSRYESSVSKIVEAAHFIDKIKADNNRLRVENKSLSEKRQEAARSEGGVPDAKKRFKRS